MKPQKKIQVNNADKLNHLIAPDMFSEDHIQVFSAKKGEWLGTIRKGQEAPPELFTEPEDPKEEKEIDNPNQSKLF